MLRARGAGQFDAAPRPGRGEEIVGSLKTDTLGAGVIRGDGASGAGDVDGRRARRRRGRGDVTNQTYALGQSVT